MRVEKIELIARQEPFSQMELRWEDKLDNHPVYKIPLDYLIYNQYNGRILTRTKSLEAFGQKINPETDEGKKLIEKLLWESKEKANKTTLENIRKYQQEKPGIITRDGIIIDGNRRAMLLNKIDECDYFKAVILPVTLEDDPIGIEKLETSYQMGEDKKLDYNPIEKYLKVKSLHNRGVEERKISEWMGEDKRTVEEYLRVMTIMDDYLEYYNYENCYTQLDGREDLFISLARWIETFRGKDSEKGFDGYTENDVNDLEQISYSYIRAKFEGKSFRLLAHGRKGSHFFGNKEIWSVFRDKHFDGIQPIEDSELEPDFGAFDVVSNLNDRDSKFAVEASQLLDGNFKNASQALNNYRHAGEPEKLITEAIKKVSVAARNDNSKIPEVVQEAAKLYNIIAKVVNNSTSESLKKVLYHLKSVDLESDNNQDSQELKDILGEIQKTLNILRKKI